MRHRRAGRKLGRNASHRLALYRNLMMSLIRHEQIITTVEKAKAVRPFVEKLITLAKKGTLHARRLVIARMGPSGDAEVKPDGDEKSADHRTVIQKLFEDIGPRFKDRPGGYTRIVKRHQYRLGDAGKTAFLALLKAGEVKTKTRAAAPAPAVEQDNQEQQTPAQPSAEQQAQQQQAEGQSAEASPAAEKPADQEAPKT